MSKIKSPATDKAIKGSFVGMERLLPVLTFFSGVAALIYESLWMRSFGLIFGNTTHAITLILATYMGGIALGSYVIGKIKILNPLRTYAIVELLIGLSAIAAFFLLKILPLFWGSFVRNTSLTEFWEVPLKIILSGSVILIPTLAMGTTVPLLVQVLSRQISHHKVLSRLYYMNTLGGALGILVCTYFLFPAFGLIKTYNIAVVLNLIIAGSCILILAYKRIPVEEIIKPGEVLSSQPIKISRSFIIIALITGATSFCLEILWSRSFALVIGSSIYSFNLMLFSFLLGLVIGTWLYEKYWTKIVNPNKLLVSLLFILGTGIMLSAFVIGRLPLVYYSLMDSLPLTFGVYQFVGFLLCFLTMILLTSLFGFIFPLLLRLTNQNTQGTVESRQITAKLYAWNTSGTLIGALLTGFVIIPLYGLQNGYLLAAVLPFILGTYLLGKSRKWESLKHTTWFAAIITAIFLLGLIWKPWEPLVVTSGLYKYGLQQNKGTRTSIRELVKSIRENKKVIYYKEGTEGVVAVTNSGGFGLYLSVNGKTDASFEDQVTQKMLAHVPLSLAKNPENVLVIGWGSGCTSGTAGLYPVKKIETIEIEPAVYESNYLFDGINKKIYNDPRFKIIFKDGRNVLHTTSNMYDVIISEPSNPWITGVSNLFTQEFYEAGLSKLNKAGVFCQWFHMYDMPLEVIKSQVQTFCSVFPDAMLWIVPPEHMRMDESASIMNGDVIMIGSHDSLTIDLGRVEQLFTTPEIKKDFNSCGIYSVEEFISNAILDRSGLIRFCGNAPLNTDENPFIELNAPKGLFHNKNESRIQIYTIYDALQKADTTILPKIINNSEFLILKNKDEKSELLKKYGNIYKKKNMLYRSERAYKKAFEINPNSANALSLADFYLKYHQNKNAVTWCEKALEFNMKDLPTMELLATIYQKMGEPNKAKILYTNMMKEFPQNEKGAFGLGMIFYNEKKYEDAELYLKKALAINSELQQASHLLVLIEGVRIKQNTGN